MVWFAPRTVPVSGVPADAVPRGLILGDDNELNAADTERSLAGGVPIRYDRSTRELVVCTSIVALPPVFLYQGPHALALSSDIALLARLPDVQLDFEPRAVAELGWFGHPVDHRTLFQNLEMVSAGGRLALRLDGGVDFRRIWRLPEGDELSWSDFIDAQIDAFTAAVRATDVSRSFLSLTAGLDTRTVLSALVADHRLVPGATMTGRQPSLDARTATRLCRAYGVTHESIVVDRQFEKDLPGLVESANRLSGGIASVSQAPEVFLYQQLAGRFSARVSGNLGNQVGRGGTEGVSIRGADLGILAPAMRAELQPESHWLLSRLEEPRAALEFILQNEIPYSSVGNYTVGNHFAVQQSPYASRALIDILGRRPGTGIAHPSGSKLRMRLRDLRHRFLGQPERVSFQRSLVKRVGGPAAEIPVNWGWYPAGGISPIGLVLGLTTMAGMVAGAKGLDDGAVGTMLRWTGIPALHDFRESRRWLRTHLKTFVMDTIHARGVRDADIFDARRLNAVLDDHFMRRRDRYGTVTFALDLALAQRLRGL